MSRPSANTPHLAARPSAGFEVRAPSNAAAIAASVAHDVHARQHVRVRGPPRRSFSTARRSAPYPAKTSRAQRLRARKEKKDGDAQRQPEDHRPRVAAKRVGAAHRANRAPCPASADTTAHRRRRTAARGESNRPKNNGINNSLPAPRAPPRRTARGTRGNRANTAPLDRAGGICFDGCFQPPFSANRARTPPGERMNARRASPLSARAAMDRSFSGRKARPAAPGFMARRFPFLGTRAGRKGAAASIARRPARRAWKRARRGVCIYSSRASKILPRRARPRNFPQNA